MRITLFLIGGVALGVLATISWLGPDTTLVDDGFTFRQTRWGMSEQEVKLAENPRIQTEQKKGQLLYRYVKGSIAGRSRTVDLIYGFIDNQLVAACYGFNQDNQQIVSPGLLREYHRLKQELQIKHKEPTSSIESEEEAHRAVGAKNQTLTHKYNTTWQTTSARIELNLREREQWMKIPYRFSLCYLDPTHYNNTVL